MHPERGLHAVLAPCTSFVPQETLQERCGAVVERGFFEGVPAVRKQYSLPQKYFSERQNLKCMRMTGFDSFVDRISDDEENLALVFPDMGRENGYTVLEQGGDISIIIRKLTEEMMCLKDHSHLPFSFAQEGRHDKDKSLNYCALLMEDPSFEYHDALKALSRQNITPVRGRYDPELSNVLVHGSDAFTIDYESMRNQDVLYPFAYSLVHLELDNAHLDKRQFISLTEKEVVGNLCAQNAFHRRLALNVAEVCGYLILEMKRLYPYYRSMPRVRDRISAAEDVLKRTLT